MANLVDFDMLWGHRNDVSGFVSGLEEFDTWLGRYIVNLSENDILMITSDHGNDPTTPSTDHSREYVPILVYGKEVEKGINLGVRKSFADLHATIADIFKINQGPNGTSFLELITD
jgi:phosphopentomutase